MDFTKNNVPRFEQISFFKQPIKNKFPSNNIILKEVYNLIISDDYFDNTRKLRELTNKQEQKLFKEVNFDYVTFHGTFNERNDGSIIMLSGLFVIDVDNLQRENITPLFERLKTNKVLSPRLIFKSPSGNGLKIVISIDTALIDTTKKSPFDNIWQAVNTYFSKEYADLIIHNEKNDFIDCAGKELSRACLLCHDASAFLNVNEDIIIGQEFLDNYPPIQTKSNKKSLKKVITSSRTTLQDLAGRYLMETENHTPQLLSFVGAAMNTGQPKEYVINYINTYVHIAQSSSKFSRDNLQSFVTDVYDRYSNIEIRYLSPLTFAYGILYFKYSASIKGYVPGGSLCRVAVEEILKKGGFGKRKIGKDFIPIQKKGPIICEVTSVTVLNYFGEYISSISENYYFTYNGEQIEVPIDNIRDIYLRDSHNIFNDKWLQHLPICNEPILKDTETEIYFFFKDKLVTVSKTEIKIENINNKTGFCIWEDQIIQHEFKYINDVTESHFAKFLNNVTNNDEKRYLTMGTAIGYLLHHYFRESEGQAVIFYDESITDAKTPMGGSGKGLILNGVKQIRKVSKVDGKHLDGGNRFCWEQITSSTQVVWVDDVKSDFDFAMLHSNLTDGWTIERKYNSQFTIPTDDSPKTGITSNSIIKAGGSTNKRRQFIVELSDFYSRQIIRGDEKPIEETHGCLFFSDTWSDSDWNEFFSVMMNCAKSYLNNGLVYYQGINVELNRFKQSTEDDFVVWIMEQNFKEKERYETSKYYNEFVSLYYGLSHQIGQRKFTGYIKEFARYKGWRFQIIQSNGISYFIF